jgi:streptogramin lyase
MTEEQVQKLNLKHAVMILAGVGLFVVGIATFHASPGQTGSAQNDPKSISGVVLNRAGHKAEAGVWVIAETTSLPTPYRKIVVTNDDGRFVVPDLPKGDYQIWVRGYGLKDSAPVKGTPGGTLTLQASNAASPREAANVYPANYWLSLFEPPSSDELRNAASSRKKVGLGELILGDPKSTDRNEWLASFKLGCIVCHQMGSQITRIETKPSDWEIAWSHASSMVMTADGLEAGQLPQPPPRPVGIERNVVVTEWEWAMWNSYLHDEIATDKRNPTLYPYGKVYAVDFAQDFLWELDPVSNRVTSHKVPTANVQAVPGDWSAMNNPAHPHNPMMDDKGRVWMTTQIRRADAQPKWASKVIVVPREDQRPAGEKLLAGFQSWSQLAYFDSNTGKFAPVDTVYATHHLQFDKQGRLWTSFPGASAGVGMLDTTKFNPSDPDSAEQAQKFYLQLDAQTGEPVPGGSGYGIAVNPLDGTVWRAHPQAGEPGNKLSEFDPRTSVFTDYHLPLPARGPRGVDASTDGMIWFATGSGHLGRLNPKTKKFTYWELPGPKIKGTGPETGSADMPYYIWVDQFDTLGLGKDMVIVNGTDSDSLVVFNPSSEKFTVIRVPYPLGFYQRGLDGRIDDAKAGWKGRGLWVDYGSDAISMFTEKNHMGAAVHVQIRPDPLAH